jgi:hypothetical protein
MPGSRSREYPANRRARRVKTGRVDMALALVDCDECGQRWRLAKDRANTGREEIAALVPPMPCSAGQASLGIERAESRAIGNIAGPLDRLDLNFASSSR